MRKMSDEFKTHTEDAVILIKPACQIAKEAKAASIIDTPDSRLYRKLLPEKLTKAREFMETNNIIPYAERLK